MGQSITEYSLILIFSPYIVVVFASIIIMSKDSVIKFISLFK